MSYARSRGWVPFGQHFDTRLCSFLWLTRSAVAGFAFALLLAGAAVAQEIPLSEFAKLPLFDDIKISPTGKYLAATVRDNDDRHNLVFMDLRTNEVTTVIQGRKRDEIVNYIWANDERVVIWLGRKVGTLDSPVETDIVTAVNWDGKQREWLLGSQKEGNVAFNREFAPIARGRQEYIDHYSRRDTT